MLLPALLGGVVADRVPQKLILLVVAAIELTCMALVAVLSLADLTQLWHLAVVGFVIGAAMAFYFPAYTAWLPALVPEEDLLAVNGFEGMIRPTVGQADRSGRRRRRGRHRLRRAPRSRSPPLASLAGLVALCTVPRTAVRREAPAADAVPVHPIRSMLHDMREGFRYMVRTPWLLATLLFASLMIFVIMGPLEVLVPFLIKDKLGGGPGDHAWVLAAFGIGGAVGSMTVASLPMPRRYLTWMNLMWGVGCLPFVVMGVATEIWMIVAAAFVLGVHVLGADGDLGDAAPAPGAAAPARPGVLARLLRVDQPDAGVDGAGRPGLRGDRAAGDVLHRGHRAGGRGRGRDRLGAAAPGRDRAPAVSVVSAETPGRGCSASPVRERMPSLR